MDPRIRVVIAVMKNNLHGEIAMSELACYVNLSPSRLRHLFKDRTGLTPIQYLRMLKMQQAREYLEKTWLSITQIAMKLGWQDRSHFERGFKRLYGETPVQYRASSRYVMLEQDSQTGHKMATSAEK